MMITELKETTKTLYDTDYNLWVLETVKQLENRDLEGLDWENLIEEVLDLGREQRHKVESYLRQLLKHLLLYQYWESEKLYCQEGWADEIDNFRAELEILLRSQTLYNYFESIVETTYQKARKSAINKTKLGIFPEKCPYKIDNILDPDWLP